MLTSRRLGGSPYPDRPPVPSQAHGWSRSGVGRFPGRDVRTATLEDGQVPMILDKAELRPSDARKTSQLKSFGQRA
jgi:hypothetical protein